MHHANMEDSRETREITHVENSLSDLLLEQIEKSRAEHPLSLAASRTGLTDLLDDRQAYNLCLGVRNASRIR